jgi:hypothetical protein
MPRHPPCALCSLPHTNTQQKQQRHTLQKQTPTPTHSAGDARVHYPEIKQPEATRPNSPGIHPDRALMSQNPNSVLENHPTGRPPTLHAPPKQRCSTSWTDHPPGQHFIDGSTIRTPPCPPNTRRWYGCVLLRKEVIQPHLPVRLPCYDFVPIASPTFDHSLHKGWAVGFGCCRLS